VAADQVDVEVWHPIAVDERVHVVVAGRTQDRRGALHRPADRSPLLGGQVRQPGSVLERLDEQMAEVGLGRGREVSHVHVVVAEDLQPWVGRCMLVADQALVGLGHVVEAR
jgi:hypothetical protein